MKIQSSSISMSSTHLEKSFQFMEHATIEGRASDDLEGVILSLSKEAEDGSYAKAIKSYEEKQKEEAKQRQEQNLKSLAQVMQAKQTENYGFDVSDEYDLIFLYYHKRGIFMKYNEAEFAKSANKYPRLPMRNACDGTW